MRRAIWHGTLALLRAAAAIALDWLTLAGAMAVGLACSAAVLLVITGWGQYDVGANAALVVSVALVSLIPAWAAWQMSRLHSSGATYGQRRLSLAVEGGPRRNALRFLMHPVSAPLWLWVGTTVFLGGSDWLTALLSGAAPAGLSVFLVIVRVPWAWRTTGLDLVTRTRVRRRHR